MTDIAVETSGAFAQRIRNFAASCIFVGAAFLIYRYSPHVAGLRQTWNDGIGASGADILTIGCVAYGLVLLLFYFIEAAPREAKSVCALRGLRTLLMSPARTLTVGLPAADRLGLLTIMVKVFFAPLMALSLFGLTTRLIANGSYLFEHLSLIGTDFLATFNSHGFWFLFDAIVFLDVLFFTVGYLVEHPVLKNEVRSVDASWLGWAVTLICYPPISSFTAHVLGGNVAEFPKFEQPLVHLVVNGMLLALMGIYTSASVALNFKGSNLTHRGIISSGPYRFVRHPAYVSKNLAWWLGTLPAIFAAWERSLWVVFFVVGSSAAWTAVYVLRALTEEDHLKQVDGEYDAYCQKVKYRFIPGVY